MGNQHCVGYLRGACNLGGHMAEASTRVGLWCCARSSPTAVAARSLCCAWEWDWPWGLYGDAFNLHV